MTRGIGFQRVRRDIRFIALELILVIPIAYGLQGIWGQFSRVADGSKAEPIVPLLGIPQLAGL